MPIISFPLLKSAVCGAGPWIFRERMTGEVMSKRISGLGSRSRSSTVSASTTSTAVMPRTAEVNSAGLFGTVGTRAKVKAMSSASNGVPSWKRAAVLSFTSQVRSSSGRMLRASRGWKRIRLSSSNSGSNTIRAIWLLFWVLWKCGSSALGGVCAPMVSTRWARAGEATSRAAMAAAAILRCMEPPDRPVCAGLIGKPEGRSPAASRITGSAAHIAARPWSRGC